MKRLFASLFLTLTLVLGGASMANAQLKGDVFTGKAKEYFKDVYETGTSAQDLQNSLPRAVGRVISAVLGLVGVILLCIMVYAGFLWLTAGGDDGQVDHAKNLIKNGVIGMAITLSAFIITNFVVNQLTSALVSSGSSGGAPRPASTPSTPPPPPADGSVGGGPSSGGR